MMLFEKAPVATNPWRHRLRGWTCAPGHAVEPGPRGVKLCRPSPSAVPVSGRQRLWGSQRSTNASTNESAIRRGVPLRIPTRPSNWAYPRATYRRGRECLSSLAPSKSSSSGAHRVRSLPGNAADDVIDRLDSEMAIGGCLHKLLQEFPQLGVAPQGVYGHVAELI